MTVYDSPWRRCNVCPSLLAKRGTAVSWGRRADEVITTSIDRLSGRDYDSKIKGEKDHVGLVFK